ncbi:Protein TEX261 [Galdieria sulphuraria]|nr:Protein TEX261 [Galdieria sulphuraria]
MISFFVLLVWLSGYVLIGFLSLSVACGLYYLAELTEEYTTTAKKVLRFFIQFNLVIHGLLWVWERFPFLYVALGVVAHLCYFELLRGFPFIELRSPIFLSCVVTFILNNVGWMRFFLNHPQLLEAYELSPVLPLFSFFAVEVCGADVPRGVGGSRFGKLSGGEWLTASGLTGKADDTLDGISTVRPKRKSLIKALTGVATDVAKKFSWNSFNNNNRKRLV